VLKLEGIKKGAAISGLVSGEVVRIVTAESTAGGLLAQLHDNTSQIVALTCRLYPLSERQSSAEEARIYNELQVTRNSILHEAAEPVWPVSGQFRPMRGADL
jgi:hypothetical protein